MNGVLSTDCAKTLSHLGNVYMRRAESSTGENAINNAKRAAFCFNQSAAIYYANKKKKNVIKMMKRFESAQSLQLKNKRKSFFHYCRLPPKAESLSRSTTFSSGESIESSHYKTVISEITWMGNYPSEYYH